MKNITQQIKEAEQNKTVALTELTEYLKHPRPWINKKWNWRSNKWE